MVSYRLTYFNARGWAEPIRWIFAVSRTKFEDVRIPIDANWATSDLKKSLPWGQLPLLEVKDADTGGSKSLAQSVTIARFVAKKVNLAGRNDWEAAKCDEIVDAIKDYIDKWKCLSIYLPTEEAKREEMMKTLMETENPKFMEKLEARTEGKGFLVNGQLTWADLYLVAIVTQWEILFQVQLAKGYAAVEAIIKRVMDMKEIKEWVEQRPKTIS